MEQTLEIYEPAPESELRLEACPFCGNNHIIYEKYNHLAGERWRVWCRDCLAGIDPGYAMSKATVQKMWNRREGG